MRKGKKGLKKGKKKEETAAVTSSQLQLTTTQQSTIKNSDSIPLPFPIGYPFPEGKFLRDEGSHQESFQIALKTSYEGLIVDSPQQIDVNHSCIEASLEQLQSSQFFRPDVTQPFGLGTKCAKTYVTRCLLGERGTTYKYLGLRMFCHPWDGSQENDPNIQKALQSIQLLNHRLTKRTAKHLADLDKIRTKRGGEKVNGRAGFDICLINRMEYSADLKPEPSTGEGWCAVSWHADSSLEHYSSIAVYHTLSHENVESGKWSIGLRVALNAEGPQASRRGTGIETSIVTDTPPIVVTLPSRSTYYLLDDFNHHHQHVVLAEGEVEGIRYSSTHRLLRDSHNVTFILERCKNVIGNFHKKGMRVWRSEQLLLTEIESEWIRQFFVQGQKHHNILWNAWSEPIQQLLKYWSQLEERTKQSIDILQLAAECRCGMNDQDPSSRPDRKRREKRKKALGTLNELMSRGTENVEVYESLADLLKERARMRDLWAKREKDHTFTKMDLESRPLHVPLRFQSPCSEIGHSPLVADVDMIATDLASFGRAFASQDRDDIPKQHLCQKTTDNLADAYRKKYDWEGWTNLQFGLEMQQPWVDLLLDGKKSIETRAYNIPKSLIGKRIEILQSSKGDVGVSSLGNTIRVDSHVVKHVGWVVFDRVIRYINRELFEADSVKHQVKRDSGYGWKEETTLIYGWVVSDVGRRELCLQQSPFATAERRMRSLFELLPLSICKRTVQSVQPKAKKKQRRF